MSGLNIFLRIFGLSDFMSKNKKAVKLYIYVNIFSNYTPYFFSMEIFRC